MTAEQRYNRMRGMLISLLDSHGLYNGSQSVNMIPFDRKEVIQHAIYFDAHPGPTRQMAANDYWAGRPVHDLKFMHRGNLHTIHAQHLVLRNNNDVHGARAALVTKTLFPEVNQGRNPDFNEYLNWAFPQQPAPNPDENKHDNDTGQSRQRLSNNQIALISVAFVAVIVVLINYKTIVKLINL